MGAITQALAEEARARGVAIRTGWRSSASSRPAGVPRGWPFRTGPSIGALRGGQRQPQDRRELAGGDTWPAAFSDYQCESATFRMNVALSELPDFTCLPERRRRRITRPASSSRLRLPTWTGACHGARDGWSREPIVEVLIPSTVDETLAPRGAHVASLFCSTFATRCRGPAMGGRAREGRRCRDRPRHPHAPNFRASVIARRILSPADLEREFGLVGGDIFHGKLALNQLFSARPVLGHGNYRMPLAGLYLCGSGAHPAAALPAFRATMRRAKSCATGGGDGDRSLLGRFYRTGLFLVQCELCLRS